MYLSKLLKHVLVFVILKIYWLVILSSCQVTNILHGLLKPRKVIHADKTHSKALSRAVSYVPPARPLVFIRI